MRPTPILALLEIRTVPEPNSGCLLWTGTRNRDGYGQTEIRRKVFGVHRLAWAAVHGEVPVGLCVMHRCDTPACVNVDHLSLGTQQENTADRVAKGRSAFGLRNGAHTMPKRRSRCLGEKHPMATLTEHVVRQIRAAMDAGALQREVAVRFGVSQSQVGRIQHRTSWSHIK
jgi:hypothetical protein